MTGCTETMPTCITQELNLPRPSIAILSIIEWKSKVRNSYYLVLLRQIFIPEVSLEKGKFPLQDYIHNSKIFFLHYRSGFRIPGHIHVHILHVCKSLVLLSKICLTICCTCTLWIYKGSLDQAGNVAECCCFAEHEHNCIFVCLK